MKTISIKTTRRIELVDITTEVRKALKDTGVESGLCSIFIPHTTAGITVNEGADPNVARDVESHLSKLVPHSGGFSHAEGNSDAHIKSVLTGQSLTLLVEGGKLVLGTWQSVFFCEFDGPRSRKVYVKVR